MENERSGKGGQNCEEKKQKKIKGEKEEREESFRAPVTFPPKEPIYNCNSPMSIFL